MSFLLKAQIMDATFASLCVLCIVIFVISAVTHESRQYLLNACIPLAILTHAMVLGIVGTVPLNKLGMK